MPFRLRIVLWYTLGVFVTIVILRLVTVTFIRIELYNEVDSSLKAEAAWISNILQSHRARRIPDAEICSEIQWRSSVNPRKEFISIRETGGGLFFRTVNLQDDSLPDATTPMGLVTVQSFRDQPVRLMGIRDSVYAITIGYSLADIESSIGRIISSSNLIIPLALLVVFATGLLLVGRFMAPIRGVNRYLAVAASGSLSRDLPPLDLTKKDEIGELSRRVAETVGKMRTSMRWILSYSSLVPHELRTPLAVIRSQLENAMKEGTTRAQLQGSVASTYDEILKLNGIIEDLLTLGKLQAGTFRLELQKMRLRNFLEGFSEEASGLAQHKGIDFVLEEGPDIPLMADLQWIRHALLNLLDNAIRHTPQGGQIRVRYAVTGSSLDLQMLDSGEGIPPGEIPHLFEPFYQGEYRDRNAPGAGLGLVLVKMIISAHGGTVHVASLPGGGTAFTMTLPLKRVSSAEATAASE